MVIQGEIFKLCLSRGLEINGGILREEPGRCPTLRQFHGEKRVAVPALGLNLECDVVHKLFTIFLAILSLFSESPGQSMTLFHRSKKLLVI